MNKSSKYTRVNYGMSVHGNQEIEAVLKVLKTSTQMGKNVIKLEKKIAETFGMKYGIMTNSGSSALMLAVEALNLPKNSEVITPALTFGTSVSSIVKNDLIPSFVDVDLNSFCIDANLIESKINNNTSAILAPDLLGNICDWQVLKKIAKKYKIKLIHDSADALGSKLLNKKLGEFCDISITSFYGSHIINGAGNGGMVCTSNNKIKNKIKVLRSWGRSSSLFEDSESISNRFGFKIDGIPYDKKFVFEEIGYQLEPSELSAAFALVQYKNLKKNISLRQKNFKRHIDFFSKFSKFFILPKENVNANTAWLAFPVIIKENSYFDRTELQIFLEKRNIQTRVIFTGNILRQPGFKNIRHKGDVNSFINSDFIMKNGILLGCHHGLNDKMFKHVHDSIKLFLRKKTNIKN
jgi:CDP-6-deoxy-D-xylo-4-hexulose-3-dehydrase